MDWRVNYIELREDVRFPLDWDVKEYKMYVFDADMNMILDVDYENLDATKNKHPFEHVIGKIKERDVKGTRLGQRFFMDRDGDIYDRKTGRRIGSVRSWGRLSNKYLKEGEAVRRQDNIGKYILNILNSTSEQELE